MTLPSIGAAVFVSTHDGKSMCFGCGALEGEEHSFDCETMRLLRTIVQYSAPLGVLKSWMATQQVAYDWRTA
mgnify:CR=1 FL=1